MLLGLVPGIEHKQQALFLPFPKLIEIEHMARLIPS
jgi:hypothetical protein